MKHDIFFNTRDLLIEWLDENFPENRLTNVAADGAKYACNGCSIEVKGLHLVINFEALEGV